MSRWVSRLVLACSLLLVAVSCGKQPAATEAAQASLVAQKPAAPSHDDLVARGKYLVTIAACHDCHTPKANVQTQELDETLLLSGRPATTNPPSQPTVMGEISASADLTAWWGPWGVSYAANLTPDPETGLGARYTEEKFIQAIRTGTKPEGEPILPPMPWPVYKNMTDDDLRAVYAYLMSVQPVKNFVRTAEAAPAAVAAPAP